MELSVILRFAWVPVLAVFLLGANALRALAARQQAAANPALTLANVARALGLSIVEGDSSFHFAVGPKPVVWALLLGAQVQRYAVRLEGAIGTHRAWLAVRSFHGRLRARLVTLWERSEYDARLVVDGLALPCAFEAWLVPGNAYLAPKASSALPVVHRARTPAGEWIVTASDANAAGAIWPVIERFASLGYVHLIGRDGSIAFVFTEVAFVSLAPRFEELREGMLALATSLAGARAA